VLRVAAAVAVALVLPVSATAAKPAAPALRLAAAGAVAAGERGVFRGRLSPARPGARVRLYRGSSVLATARAARDGRFSLAARVSAPGPYTARTRGLVSNPVRVVVRPQLAARLVGSRVVGERLALVASLRPAAAGAIRVRILRGGEESFARLYRGVARVSVGTTRAAPLRIEVETIPRAGYAVRRTALAASLTFPDVRPGSTGAAVVALRERLAELGYLVPAASATFTWELRDSVVAFQKVLGLPRDGVVTQAVWRRLEQAVPPRPRYAEPADHIEVDKSRQVLYVVVGGEVAGVLPVSTAGIAGYFTPTGRFAFYRKVLGWDPSPLGVLLHPLYFHGGYAIHGSPSVPPYPASHGCVRIPIWAAYGFYTAHGAGEPVYVYE
jgi:hypothetical protein